MSERGSIRIDAVPPLPTIIPEILNLGLALLLARRRYQILHGGALARRAACAAVLGPPGAGKSSLILAGARLGMEVVSDEIVPFRRRGAAFLCPGSNPAIRVDQALLSVRQVRAMPRGHEVDGKVAVDVRQLGWRCADGPRRLASLVLLGPRLGRRQPPFRIEPIPPAEALIALLENTYNRRVQSPPERRRHLRDCAAAARSLPAYRLSVRHGIANVAAAARGLDDLLARHLPDAVQLDSGQRSGA